MKNKITNEINGCDQETTKAVTNYDPSIAAEKQKQADELHAEGRKLQAGAYFLLDHPEFDEFIQLIRKGSIQI
jgi:DNA-binding SARP family transcriptional activator